MFYKKHCVYVRERERERERKRERERERNKSYKLFLTTTNQINYFITAFKTVALREPVAIKSMVFK
jgi:hypothetical protein